MGRLDIEAFPKGIPVRSRNQYVEDTVIVIVRCHLLDLCLFLQLS